MTTKACFRPELSPSIISMSLEITPLSTEKRCCPPCFTVLRSTDRRRAFTFRLATCLHNFVAPFLIFTDTFSVSALCPGLRRRDKRRVKYKEFLLLMCSTSNWKYTNLVKKQPTIFTCGGSSQVYKCPMFFFTVNEWTFWSAVQTLISQWGWPIMDIWISWIFGYQGY